MKKNIEQFSKLSRDDLRKKADELRSEIVNTRRGIKLGDVINTQITKKNRKDLARILTLLAKPESIDNADKPAKKEKK